MCHAQIIRFICDCQRICGVDFCRYHQEEGLQICSRKLTSTIVDQINACRTCTAERIHNLDSHLNRSSRLPAGLVLDALLRKLNQRLTDLAAAYEEIGKQFHRVPLAIRHDARLRESQRRVYLPIFHATVQPAANSWFCPWQAAVRDYNAARVEASRSVDSAQALYRQARVRVEVAEARIVAARRFVDRVNAVWRLVPQHQNSPADLIQIDIYIRRWLATLSRHAT